MDVDRTTKVLTFYGLGLIALFLGVTSFVSAIFAASVVLAGVFFTLGWRSGRRHPRAKRARRSPAST